MSFSFLQFQNDSINFNHRPIVNIDQLLPVEEVQAIDEDAFGNWLEEMDNWNEQLPNISDACLHRDLAQDTIQRTLQQGPPLESECPSSHFTHQHLVIRPEDIGVLLTGLDQQEFRQVLSGMFVGFDFGRGLNGIKIHLGDLVSNLRDQWALSVVDVTFEPNVSQHSLPFLPPHLRSNALLHIDPQLQIIQANSSRITTFPIPQTQELLKRHYPWSRMNEMKYCFPSQEFINSKVQQFWQAWNKAKCVPFNLDQASVLPAPKLPKLESSQIPM